MKKYYVVFYEDEKTGDVTGLSLCRDYEGEVPEEILEGMDGYDKDKEMPPSVYVSFSSESVLTLIKAKERIDHQINEYDNGRFATP